jgi:cytochrome c553
MLLSLGILTLVTNAEPSSTNVQEIELGRRIYMEGILPSGEPLKGLRTNSVGLEGAAAACETCHRRSGMGSLEGGIVVTPITGNYLFATADNRPMALVDPHSPQNITRAHDPYTEETLAKAIRNGVNVSGNPMSKLMPQYPLNDVEIKAVSAYLRQLSTELSPGVGMDNLHFATIVTPGVDKKESAVMVDMIIAGFNHRNASQQSYSGRMRSPIDLIPRILRNWELTVWELQGAPETWAAQLTENYRNDPVFAVISGISNTTWTPVHEFCQKEKVPCILPSISLPPKETATYPLYYSRGVALEADVLATHLRNQEKKAPKRLIQVYRDDEIGRGATKTLTEALHDSSVKVESRVLRNLEPSSIKEVLKGVSSKDAVVMWLPSADLSAINKTGPKKLPAITYVSGILAEDNYDFAVQAWKHQIRVIYPYELGDKRQKNVATLKEWLKTWQLPLVNEPFQSEVFFNVLLLTDITSQMLDNLYRDYLIERADDMLSLGSNVSVYPYLSLAREQGFASKGAYIARFAANAKLVADTEWIVP